MNLSELKSEQTGTVTSIDLPVREKQRLASLGIIQGSTLYVLRNNRNASLVIEYRDTFMALSFDIAQHIFITTPNASAKERTSI